MQKRTGVNLLAGASADNSDALLLWHLLACVRHAIPAAHWLRIGWAHICMAARPQTISRHASLASQVERPACSRCVGC